MCWRNDGLWSAFYALQGVIFISNYAHLLIPLELLIITSPWTWVVAVFADQTILLVMVMLVWDYRSDLDPGCFSRVGLGSGFFFGALSRPRSGFILLVWSGSPGQLQPDLKQWLYMSRGQTKQPTTIVSKRGTHVSWLSNKAEVYFFSVNKTFSYIILH